MVAEFKTKEKKEMEICFLVYLVFTDYCFGSSLLHLRGSVQTKCMDTGDKPVAIFIPTGSDFETVKVIFIKMGLSYNRDNFEWVAEKKGYPDKITHRENILYQTVMNNNELVNMLRSGNQTPVKVIFNNVRDIYQLAGKVGGQIEADSASIVKMLTDSLFLEQKGLNLETVSIIFIPNTYEFYWNTNAEQFVERMYHGIPEILVGKTQYACFRNGNDASRSGYAGFNS